MRNIINTLCNFDCSSYDFPGNKAKKRFQPQWLLDGQSSEQLFSAHILEHPWRVWHGGTCNPKRSSFMLFMYVHANCRIYHSKMLNLKFTHTKKKPIKKKKIKTSYMQIIIYKGLWNSLPASSGGHLCYRKPSFIFKIITLHTTYCLWCLATYYKQNL